MTTQRPIVMWGAFAATAILTMVMFQFGWALDHYEKYLAVMGVVSLATGVWVLFNLGVRWSSCLLVLLGIVIGQWWFFEGLLMRVSWLLKGFV